MTPKPHGALQPAPGVRRCCCASASLPALLAALAGLLLLASLAARAGPPAAPAAALAPAPLLLLPPCTALQALLEGSWGVRLAPGAPPQLLAWQPPPAAACQGALPGPGLLPLAGLRGRALALVGDSVTRYLAVDLAVELFGCHAMGWDGVACAGSAGASAASPACAALHAYACAGKRHEDLLLSDPATRTALHLVWATTAEGLTRGTPAGVLQGGRYDGIAVSVGLWDVAVKTEGEAYSLQHHCAWMHSHVQAALAAALAAAPQLAQRLVFWAPPFTEPRSQNHVRIPRGELEVANGCTAAGLAGAGLALANTSALLGAPAAAFEALLREPEGGVLLTQDGYHPHRRVRAVLLNGLLQYFYGVWEAEGASGQRRGTAAAAPAAGQ